MIRYRPFLNTDPPAIAEIWRSHPPLRGLAQPMSAELLEELVMSKPYFDRFGLILATQDERPVGFVHAGFGPSRDFSSLDPEVGAICVLMVTPHEHEARIAAGLLAQSEAYLQRRGARQIYGGGIHPVNPFYVGLYGGSELPGVLESDELSLKTFRKAGYEEVRRCVTLHRDLAGFRPPVNRQQLQLRRQCKVQVEPDPADENWWEACTVGHTERTRFTLHDRQSNLRGTLTLWNMEPLSSGWGVRAMGLTKLEIVPESRRRGMATCLVSEAMRQAQAEGINLVEAQSMRDNMPTIAFYKKLGFKEVEDSIVVRKQVSPELPSISNREVSRS